MNLKKQNSKSKIGLIMTNAVMTLLVVAIALMMIISVIMSHLNLNDNT